MGFCLDVNVADAAIIMDLPEFSTYILLVWAFFCRSGLG